MNPLPCQVPLEELGANEPAPIVGVACPCGAKTQLPNSMQTHFAVMSLGLVILLTVTVAAAGMSIGTNPGAGGAAQPHQEFQYEETRQLVDLVKDAAERVRTKGEEAFGDFRTSGSRWRREDTYVFVLDPAGNMLVHPDREMEGRKELELRDVDGKPIIRGLIQAAVTFPDKPEGWYHYRWPVPGGLLPRWKSSYVRLVQAPSGRSYVVGSGMYNDRMERAFVVDMVRDACGQIEKDGPAAFRLFHDHQGPFLAKDAYIFVYELSGTNLVLPPFPNLEGRNLMDMKDTHGKPLIREMVQLLETRESGWVDYLWPKPGESVSTLKSAYVRKAVMKDRTVLVGCGVYLDEAPKTAPVAGKMTAPELMALVREGAALLGKEGEKAYAELGRKGTRWFHGETYLFVWSRDGTWKFHAAEPEGKGRDGSIMKDIIGRPIGRMIIEAAQGPSGEGWVHYMYPEPGGLFPAWKSTFVKRVTFPSGEEHLVASGIYHMQMDRTFVEDVVNRAAGLIARRGREAFGTLRDKTGPFVFMDTYIFVISPEGLELVNPVMPSLEGKTLIDLKDVKGRPVVKEEIAAAMSKGSAWVDLYWFKPGSNTPARKATFVRQVQFGKETYIVGSGVYLAE